MDRRVHLRFFFSWHHRSYIVVVRGLWPHRGWSIFWPPPAPLSFGDGPYSPTLFRPTDHAARRTDPLAQSHRLYLSLSTRWMWTDNLTLFGQKKTSSSLHNPKHLRRNSLCRYCTFHRKPDFPPSPPCFFSAGLTGYLLLLPQPLNRGERAFCGIGGICIAN